MLTPTEKQTKATIKNIRKATAVYIHTIRKASKSQWFPDIEETNEQGKPLTITQFTLNCMKAIDEANTKFIK
jgi:hypothetical protein